MLIPLFSALGWLVARVPEPMLRLFCGLMGEALLWLQPGRRRLMLSNLEHAFPERTAAWRQAITRESCRQLAETGLLSLATPYLSERRIRRIARLAPSVEAWLREPPEERRPTVLATLHLALWESQTWLKLLSPVPLPEYGIIFRPLDNAAADRYVKRTRERFGMRLLSRREGFAAALQILRGGGCVGVLFDQNAGLQGCLTLLFGRVCSTTELPGLLAEKLTADVRTFYPRRTGFWRVEFESHPVDHDGTASGVTLALNRWLESALAGNDGLCASWLWAHNRWRHQDIPSRRFRLESRRNLLGADLAARGLSVLPRRTRIWVRLPNWLGDVAMALPLLRALRHSRPDAEIVVFARGAFEPLLRRCAFIDRIESLPQRGWGYFRCFTARRTNYPDVWLAFTNSWRGDLEGWMTGAPQRFGIIRPGLRRPLLTSAFRARPSSEESRRHQCELWEEYFRHFGLQSPVTHAPIDEVRPAAAAGAPIGLIAGSENNPEKRWPVSGWRELIAGLPGERFLLLGTARDQPITSAIAAGHPPERVLDLAGQTSLAEFGERLRSCRLVVTNDTGGMHLANALGVPLVALFGPTNPVRTGPVYAAPRVILQPPGCAATGGGSLSQLSPRSVLTAVAALGESVRR